MATRPKAGPLYRRALNEYRSRCKGKTMKAIAPIGRSIPVQSKDTVIHFDEGLIGFSDCKDFQVIEDDRLSPFRLLQSSQTKVRFLVLEPSVVMFDYHSRIPAREWEL